MMKVCKLCCSFLSLTAIPFLCQAQLQKTEPAPARYHSSSQTQPQQASDTLLLPFFEDFSNTPGPAPDSSRWQASSPVFINNALAIRPPSLGVATFDGLNASNQAYSNDTNLSDFADSLVSQPIDLSGLSATEAASTYLSFYWQLEGRGDRPDPEDALNLYFLDADSNWVQVWRQVVSEEQAAETFTQEILPLSDASGAHNFFHAGFRFKFHSENRLSGRFDLWHLDYVYLNKDRSASDIYYGDRTISEPIGSWLQPYTAMPMAQFRANPTAYLRDQLTYTAFSLRAPNTLEAVEYNEILFANGQYIDTLGFEVLLQNDANELLVGQRYLNDQANSLKADKLQDIISLGDSVVTETLFYLNTEDNDTFFLRNDTLRVQTYLTDFFAYDDGTAEIGVGLNGPGQRVAVAFTLEVPDTLTHLQIAFPYYLRNPSGQLINVQLWRSLADPEGTTTDSLLYEQPGVTIPSVTNQQGFVEIPLNNPRILPAGTFYIGFEQRTNGRLAIGFDRQNDATEFIYSSPDGLNWLQGFDEPGALQIRPRFQQGIDPAVLGVAEDAFLETRLYPNPARRYVRIHSRATHFTLVDMQGRICLQEKKAQNNTAALTLNLEGLQPGIYLLQMTDGRKYSTRKLLIE